MVAAANKAKSEWTLLDKIKSLNEWIDIIMLPYDFSLKGDPAEKRQIMVGMMHYI